MRTAVPAELCPEEQELLRKKEQLEDLRTTLAEKELELATLVEEFRAFETQYLATVGKRLLELEAVRGELDGGGVVGPSAEAQAQRPESEHGPTSSPDGLEVDSAATGTAGQFSPPSDLKALFREIVREIHPDLSSNDHDRSRRTELLKRANAAYRICDGEALQSVLRAWKSSPENVVGEGTAADLVRTIRAIAQVSFRLDAIDQEVAALRSSELASLKARVDESRSKGRDLLAELDLRIQTEIGALRAHMGKESTP